MTKRCTGWLVCAIAAIALAMPTAWAQVPTPDPQTTATGAQVPTSDPPPAVTADPTAASQTVPNSTPTAPTGDSALATDPTVPPADPTTTTAPAVPPPAVMPAPGPAPASGGNKNDGSGSGTGSSGSGSGSGSTSAASVSGSTSPSLASSTDTAPPPTDPNDSQDPPPPPAPDPTPAPGTPPDVPSLNSARFLIRARADVIDDVISRHGLTAIMPVHDTGTPGTPDAERVMLISGPDGMTAEDVDALMDSDPDIRGCERDRTLLMPELAGGDVRASVATIADGIASRTLTTFFGNLAPSTYVTQPASTLIRLPDVRAQFTGAGIVAIIDTGVDATHPLLNGSVTSGYDFTREQAGVASDVLDLDQSTAAILEQSTAAILEQNQVIVLNQSTAAILEQSTAAILEGMTLPKSFGHGTMVAGLVHLTAPTASIMPLKAFTAGGASTIADVVRAIYYAVDHGARVINMSFSLTDPSPELMKAINYATSHRVTCVAASGNLGLETVVYPAAYRNVIAVASTDNFDHRSLFSNWGDADVTLAAPGEGVTTTYPGGHFAAASGTSFSTALVSGAVSLMLQGQPGLTPRDAFENLSHGAKITPRMGYGRLDLMRAVSKDGESDGKD